MQLLASEDRLGPELFEAVREVKLGDVVGVEGEAVASRRGELSLDLTGYQLLAHCQLPLPDLHHGLTDVEARYRQRYLDLLVNPESRTIFQLRARVITALRRHLDEDGFVEVETPTLVPLYGGANARPFTTHHNELDRDLYLRIATELYLKRLVVGGLERVYEIGKNFRNEGVSYKHNPEFTLLEWYEAYADCEDAMRRTEASCGSRRSRPSARPSSRPRARRSISRRPGRASRWASPSPRRRASTRSRGRATRPGCAAGSRPTAWTPPTTRPGQLVDHMLSHYVEPYLVEPTFLVDYPVELSPWPAATRTTPRASSASRRSAAAWRSPTGSRS